jgi:hypothetical protein
MTKLNHLIAKLSNPHSTRLSVYCSTMINLTDWRERELRFSTFYRCENVKEQE